MNESINIRLVIVLVMSTSLRTQNSGLEFGLHVAYSIYVAHLSIPANSVWGAGYDGSLRRDLVLLL